MRMEGKIITLSGDPEKLNLGQSISYEEIDLQTFPEEEIVYQDLVFTLKHKPGAYSRPLVSHENGELYVIANTLFFKAAKEAGLKKIKFDLLLNGNVQLEKLIDEKELEFVLKARKKDSLDRYLFFQEKPKNYLEVEGVYLNDENESLKYSEMNCWGYEIFLRDKKPREVMSIERNFITRVVKQNGKLRSIDGLIKKIGKFSKYFDVY